MVSPDFDSIQEQTLIPTHVAIIMDGNGRWAQKRMLNRIKGHEQGSKTVRSIVETSREIGVNVLTLYAFSTENWQRPKNEVNALMTLLVSFLRSEEKNMLDNNIRLMSIGELHRLPKEVQQALNRVISITQYNTGMILNLALSYGSRSELVDMVKKIATGVKSGSIEIDTITPEVISANLFSMNLPDPDILIRTSGEMRISNFMLWQLAYTELFFTETLWPDFTKEEYLQILHSYQLRERRYGTVST
ncbi:MAG: isoprenyl transferase [Desulfobacterales bacterium]|nr:isoprenyl transferase [Desulfobacterales bacterium]